MNIFDFRKLTNTGVLYLIIALIVGFGLGFLVKSDNTSQNQSQTRALAPGLHAPANGQPGKNSFGIGPNGSAARGSHGTSANGNGFPGFGGYGGALIGTVQSVGTGSFTVKKESTGATDTVTVSGSTTYHDLGASSASFSSVAAGGCVLVEGTSSGSTVTATSVSVFPSSSTFNPCNGFSKPSSSSSSSSSAT